MTQKTLERILVVVEKESGMDYLYREAMEFFRDKPVEVSYAGSVEEARSMYAGVDAVIADAREYYQFTRPPELAVSAQELLEMGIALCNPGRSEFVPSSISHYSMIPRLCRNGLWSLNIEYTQGLLADGRRLGNDWKGAYEILTRYFGKPAAKSRENPSE